MISVGKKYLNSFNIMSMFNHQLQFSEMQTYYNFFLYVLNNSFLYCLVKITSRTECLNQKCCSIIFLPVLLIEG